MIGIKTTIFFDNCVCVEGNIRQKNWLFQVLYKKVRAIDYTKKKTKSGKKIFFYVITKDTSLFL